MVSKTVIKTLKTEIYTGLFRKTLTVFQSNFFQHYFQHSAIYNTRISHNETISLKVGIHYTGYFELSSLKFDYEFCKFLCFHDGS
jgi:hypothetical protein